MSKKDRSFLHDMKLNWWQMGLFKTAAVSFGILLALYFGEFLQQFMTLFWVTFLIPGTYIAYLYFKK